MSTPNPATTPWVPLWDLNGGVNLDYKGAWAAGSYKDGEIVVYNGVAYLCTRPTVNPPGPWAVSSAIPQPVVNGQWLKGSGGAVVWSAISPADIGGGYAPNKISVGTMSAGPPASPATNDIWIATDVDANGTCWHFRYNGGSASPYKWEFIGGPPLFAKDDTTVSGVVSTTYVALGPTFNLPRAGDYDWLLSARVENNTSAQLSAVAVGFGGVASDLDGMFLYSNALPNIVALTTSRRQLGLSGGSLTAQVQCRVSGGQGTFYVRSLKMLPVRIS